MELIKFYALLKSTLWGGEKIVPFKHLSTEQHNVGENWEISGVPDNCLLYTSPSPRDS